MAAVKNKAQRWVFEALPDIEGRLPFPQEQDDEWQVMDRRYFSIESMRRIDEHREGGETPKELWQRSRS